MSEPDNEAKITLSDDRSSLIVSFRFSWELAGLVGKISRAKFDKTKKNWIIPISRSSGNELWKIFGKEAFAQEVIDAIQAIPKSVAISEGIPIPAEVAEDRVPGILPTAPKLFGYQKEGVAFMMHNKRVFNADGVGLGKSGQAITAAVASGCERILVVCYNFLVPNWDAEIQKWTGNVATVVRAGKGGLMKASASEIHALTGKSKFCIVHYEILAKCEGILDEKWDCVIADESHALKGREAGRSKAARGIKSDYMFLLTGTPVLNRPIELWSQLDIMVPGEFGSYWTFGDRYCLGEPIRIPTGVWCPDCNVRRRTVKDPCVRCGTTKPAEKKWDLKKSYNGAHNLDELHDRLKPFMISRKRNDVKKDLPPFTRVDRLVELSAEHRAAYETLEEDLVEYLMNYEEKTLAEATKSATSEPMVRAGKFKQILSGAKLTYCADEVRQILASGASVIAFTCYVESARKLGELITNGREAGDEKMLAYVHTGEESLTEKTSAISQFKAKGPSALVCTIQSAGVGLNLTEASYIFFVDLPWTPAEIIQAEGRILRIGQTAEKVTYIRYFASGTYDAVIMGKLRTKQEIFDTLIGAADGTGVNADERMDDFRKVVLRELFYKSRKKKKKAAA